MSSLSRPGALAGLGLLCVLVALGGCAEPGPNPTHEPEPVRATPANQTPASATPANVTPASPAPPAETPPIRHIATLADELAAHPPQPAGASLSPAAPASSPAMPVLSAERRRAQQTMLAALREFVSDRDTGKAREALVRAAGEDPSYAEPPYNLAILAEAEENWAEAIRYYEQVEALATPQDPLRKTAAEKLGLVRQLEADSQTPEGKLDVQYTLSVDRARQFLAAQQPAEAVAEAERAITLLPNRYEAYCVAALAERELGAFESAIGRLRHAKEVAPAEMIPKLDSSLQELEIDEAYATTVASAGDALAAGQYDQAAGLYADALRTKPSEQQIGLKLATALVLAGNTEQARPVMNGLLASRSPDVVYGATLQLKALDMAANAEKSQAQIVEATRMTAQMQEEARRLLERSVEYQRASNAAAGLYMERVPDDLSLALVRLAAARNPIRAVAANGDRAWAILYGNNSHVASNLPQQLAEYLESQSHGGAAVRRISFGPNDSWVAVAGGNGYWGHSVPNALVEALKSAHDNGTVISDVTLGPNSSWYFVQGGNGWWYDGVPSGLANAIKSLHDKGSTVNHVALTPDGGWPIIYDNTGYWYQSIPTAMVTVLAQLNTERKKIAAIAFTGADGWVVVQEQPPVEK